MLHGKAPAQTLCLNPRNHAAPPRSARKKAAGRFRISDGCREADPAGHYLRHPAQALDQAQGLAAPVSPEQGMDLIDHNKPEVSEKIRNLPVLSQKQSFQGFRRNLQNAGRMFQKLLFMGRRHVAVPVPDGNAGLLTEIIQTSELVVDQRLQRRDIDTADRSRGILIKQSQDRKKGGFRLAGSRGSRQQYIFIRFKDRFARRRLDRPKVLPVAAVYEILNKWRITAENIHLQVLSVLYDFHKVNSANSSSASSLTASDFA